VLQYRILTLMDRKKIERCEYCEGHVFSKVVRIDHRWKGHLVVIEHVPVGVCNRCGERYYDAEVLHALDRMAQGHVATKKTIKVPIADYKLILA